MRFVYKASMKEASLGFSGSAAPSLELNDAANAISSSAQRFKTYILTQLIKRKHRRLTQLVVLFKTWVPPLDRSVYLLSTC